MIAKQTDSNPAPSRTRRPAAFFDRDGVLNVDHGYVHRTEQLEWVAGAPESVRLLNEAGYYVLVITNQSGVARGFFDEAAVKAFHAHMQNVLAEKGAHIDAFYYCPHHPEGTVKAFAMACNCRKPRSVMLEQALRMAIRAALVDAVLVAPGLYVGHELQIFGAQTVILKYAI